MAQTRSASTRACPTATIFDEEMAIGEDEHSAAPPSTSLLPPPRLPDLVSPTPPPSPSPPSPPSPPPMTLPPHPGPDRRYRRSAPARDLTSTHTGARRTGARVAAAAVIASACDPCTSLCPCWHGGRHAPGTCSGRPASSRHPACSSSSSSPAAAPNMPWTGTVRKIRALHEGPHEEQLRRSSVTASPSSASSTSAVVGPPLVNGPRSPIGSGSAEESVPQEYRLWVPGDGEAARRRVDDAEATRRRVDDAEATRRRLDIWVRERLPLACVTAATRGVKPRNLLNSETNR
jgi:hypothetical protein